MIDLFRKVFETTLFPAASQGGHVFVSGAAEESEGASGVWAFPTHLMPESCKIHSLRSGEAFVNELREKLIRLSPSRSLIFPPFIPSRKLSDTRRSQFRHADLHEIALLMAMDSLPKGSLVGIILPTPSFFSERSAVFRKTLVESGTPRWFIPLDLPVRNKVFPGIHHASQMQLLVIETGSTDQPTGRFFKCPEDYDSQHEVITDLERLAQQPGGRTKYGYVVRQGIPADSPWLFEAHDPALRQQVKDMQNFGGVRPLGELVDIRLGLRLAMSANDLIEGDSDDGIPVIEGRNILPSSHLSFEETRYRYGGFPDESYLQEGDICTRSLLSPGQNLKAVKIERGMLPLVAADSIIILRPRPAETFDIDFLLDYLKSDQAGRLLLAQGATLRLSVRNLKSLPVPIMDPTLKKAVQDLREATKSFENWRTEAEQAGNSVFGFASAKDTRLYILSTGRRARQRQLSAALVDDFSYRVRTRFPHPIAYRWRTVEASKPDLEGYLNVLECAETIVCYLACVTIIASRAVQDSSIGYLTSMADRLTRRAQGTSLGDWMAIVREGQKLKKSNDSVPFYEIAGFLDNDVDGALQLLKENRDDQAHGRGPRTSQRIDACFHSSKEAVVKMLRSIEFLSEYPLRLIESVRRDTLVGTTTYDYRELMGDHPLVPLTPDNTTQMSDLEVDSLYLADRTEQLYLLRPFFICRECPECGRRAIFYLDRYRKSDDLCILKSLEHGHTMADDAISEAFRHVGMLTGG